MSGLDQFLQYLDRSDVTEIVFQSGANATAKKKGIQRAVTREPLSAKHILKLVRDTPLEELIPREDGASPPTTTQLNGIDYVTTIVRSGDMLLMRVRREGRDTVLPEAPLEAVAPANDRAAAPEPTPVEQDVRAQRPVSHRPSPEPAPKRAPERAPEPSYRPQPEPLPEPQAQPIAHQRRPEPIAHRPRPEPRPRVSFRPPPESAGLPEFARSDAPVDASPALCALLSEARTQSASDVHIMSGEPVRFRCGGRMIPHGQQISDAEAHGLLMPILGPLNAKQLQERGYADFACQIEGAGRVRVNVNNQRGGLKGCFRLVMSEPPTLESLGLPHELRQMLNYHQGLVVVSGPNGAGKSTTLAALVDMFNSERSVHIITVEDPVEVLHPIKKAIVSQREVGSHTKSFHSALKGSLREDPDVIAIGELRDRETVEKALEAAETGHLVFATMSTPSGASTIDRLIDMFPPDDQSQVRATLAGALKFVVSQRLVPRKGGDGRVVAVELLTGGMALWTLIRDDKLYQLPSLLQRGRGFGMIRIEDSLNELLQKGEIDLATAERFADDPRAIGASQKQSAPRPESKGSKGAMRNPFSKKGR